MTTYPHLDDNLPHCLKIARDSNYLADKISVLPSNCKESRIRVEDKPITSIKITDIS
jgi:hypothetical protein